MRRVLLGAAMLLTGCSPVYVLKSAAGHTALLWRRKSVDKMLADPKTSDALREKLKLVQEIRAFAFGEMGLKRTGAYSTVSQVEGCCVTYIVSGCEKTSFKQFQWWFPVVGRVPYKGYFRKSEAEGEALRLEGRGLDSSVGGVLAYHTGLWFSDPIPSPVLDDPPGELASLLIHELTHGTVFFKSAVDFDESLAEFTGNRGAEDFLTRRFGSGSRELRDFRASLAEGKAFDRLMAGFYAQLDTLYKSGRSDEDKLKERKKAFAALADALKELLGKPYAGKINNAMIMAHRIYHEESDDFEAVYEANGKEWKKTMVVFKSLDGRNPRAAMRVYLRKALPNL